MQKSAILLIILAQICFTVFGEVYEGKNSTVKYSIQRNTSVSVAFPFADAFYWNISLPDNEGKDSKSSPFCSTVASKLTTRQVLCVDTLLNLGTNPEAVVFEKTVSSSLETLLFLIDSRHKQLRWFGFVIQPNDYDNMLSVKQYAPKAFKDLTTHNLDWEDPETFHILTLENTDILVTINNQTEIYSIDSTFPGNATYISSQNLNISSAKEMLYFGNYLYVITTDQEIVVYSVNNRIISKTNVTFTQQDFTETINLVGMAIDQNKKLLYVLDSDAGVYIIDLSQDLVNLSLKQMNTPVIITNATKIHYGEKNVLFVEYEYNLASITVELTPNGTDYLNGDYIVLRTYKNIPDIRYISTQENLAVVTIANVVEIFKYGIPQSYLTNSLAGLDTSIASPQVKLAYPFHHLSKSLLYVAGNTQICVHEIENPPPTLYCSPPSTINTATYTYQTEVRSMSCLGKTAAENTSPLSICKENLTFQIEVWDELIHGGNKGLAIGLSIGLVFLLITLGFCCHFWKKAKYYERLRNEGEGKEGKKSKSQDKSVSDSSQSNDQPALTSKEDVDLKPKNIEIAVAEHKPAAGFDAGDEDIDDIYKGC